MKTKVLSRESKDKLMISKCMEHINHLPIEKIVRQDRKGEKFSTHPLILIKKTARPAHTFVNKFAPFVPRQKGREILTHPLILTKTARDTLKPLCISLHR